jgi:hypothetical protein
VTLATSLEASLRRISRKTYNWLYRVLMLEFGGLVARHCSPATTRRVAASIGWVLWALPWNRSIRESFRAAFPDGPTDPATTASRWLARPFRDHMMITAWLADRRGFIPEQARHEMSPATKALFDSDETLLIAMSHMSREAILVLFQPGVVPRRMMPVIAEMPGELNTHRRRRSREQFGRLIDVAALARPDTVLVTRGNLATTRELVERSKEPGWAPNLHIDAMPPKQVAGWFERPFAGLAKRSFAPGIAKLARLTQVPTVFCTPHFEPNGEEVVLTWSDPIPPPRHRDDEADQRFTSMLLNEAERAVGRWPDQYVLPIGSARRWDPIGEVWVDTGDPASTAADTAGTT